MFVSSSTFFGLVDPVLELLLTGPLWQEQPDLTPLTRRFPGVQQVVLLVATRVAGALV